VKNFFLKKVLRFSKIRVLFLKQCFLCETKPLEWIRIHEGTGWIEGKQGKPRGSGEIAQPRSVPWNRLSHFLG